MTPRPFACLGQDARVDRATQHREGAYSDYRRAIGRPHVKMRYAVLATENL